MECYIQLEVAKVVYITGDERKSYPVPGKEGEYFTSRLDVENAKHYAGNEFERALDYFYELAAIVYGEQSGQIKK